MPLNPFPILKHSEVEFDSSNSSTTLSTKFGAIVPLIRFLPSKSQEFDENKSYASTKSSHYWLLNDEPEHYSVKYCKKSSNKDVQQEMIRMLDHEITMLVSLDHPHLATLRGVSEDINVKLTVNLFCLMDRIEGSLVGKMQAWKKSATKTQSKLKGPLRKIINSPTRKTKLKREEEILCVDQLLVSIEVALALEYLHSKHLLHRDIKPQHIGFSPSDESKILDFGIMRHLPIDKVDVDGLYKLTSHAGSIPYMSPEVMDCKRYGLSADVYSFGIVLYEIMTLSRAFKDVTYFCNNPDEFLQKVAKENLRPSIPSSLSRPLRMLIEKCWDDDINSRPNMCQIISVLFRSVMQHKGVISLPQTEEEALRAERFQKISSMMVENEDGFMETEATNTNISMLAKQLFQVNESSQTPTSNPTSAFTKNENEQALKNMDISKGEDGIECNLSTKSQSGNATQRENVEEVNKSQALNEKDSNPFTKPQSKSATQKENVEKVYKNQALDGEESNVVSKSISNDEDNDSDLKPYRLVDHVCAGYKNVLCQVGLAKPKKEDFEGDDDDLTATSTNSEDLLAGDKDYKPVKWTDVFNNCGENFLKVNIEDPLSDDEPETADEEKCSLKKEDEENHMIDTT